MKQEPGITAAMLAIGDELLSGRTRDRNIGHLAGLLTIKGIDLKQVRIVGDEHQEIVAAVNALRQRYTYVFTSGGIGPTHDDITADAIAAAFGVGIGPDPAAVALLAAHYRERNLEFTQARQRMARLPVGASMIANPVSRAPGFMIGNVYVMAGVPAVFEAMLDTVLANLKSGTVMQSRAIESRFPEGQIGTALGEIAKRHPQASIGSYPRFDGANPFSTQIVIRARDHAAIDLAAAEVEVMLAAFCIDATGS